MLVLHDKDVLTEGASKGQPGALTTMQVSCFGFTFLQRHVLSHACSWSNAWGFRRKVMSSPCAKGYNTQAIKMHSILDHWTVSMEMPWSPGSLWIYLWSR